MIKLYKAIARTAQWQPPTQKLLDYKQHQINRFNALLPSGSGFNTGSMIKIDDCQPDEIVIFTEYQHMNENGFYTGWSQHTLKITPSLAFEIYIDIESEYNELDQDYKDQELDQDNHDDYILDEFYRVLTQEIDEYDPDYKLTI